jgi:hypothetical protein
MNIELNTNPLPPLEFYRGLCPELRAAVELRSDEQIAIYHPLIHDPFGTIRLHNTPEEVNKSLEQIKRIAQKHREERNWLGYIVRHAKPYRLEALWAVRNEMTDREFWTAVGQVWTDSENVWQYRQHWHLIFLSPRPEREYMMPEEDRAAFAAMPEQLTIYRGCNRLNKHGFSWTLNRQVAEMFTRRNIINAETGKRVKTRVIERVIHKSEAIAYLNDRKEEEIVTLKFEKKGSL